jgi:hypothetical protein
LAADRPSLNGAAGEVVGELADFGEAVDLAQSP